MPKGTLQKEYDKLLLDKLKLQLEVCLENQKLKELLIEYGRHSPDCPARYNTTKRKNPCRCGWDREKKILKG